jgi:hypothetical protein
MRWFTLTLVVIAGLLLVCGSCNTSHTDTKKRNPTPAPAQPVQTSIAATQSEQTEQNPKAQPSSDSLVRPDGQAFNPSDLLGAYESNEISADQLYKGKRVFVEAVVEKVGRDMSGQPYIILRDYLPHKGARTVRNDLRSVQAFFPSSALQQLAHLQSGVMILVTGTCDGLMLNVLLRDCVLDYASSFQY